MSSDKKIVFVAGCVLCPSFQAVENEKTKGWSSLVLEYLVESGYNVMPLICPEVTYGGYIKGSKRKKHGVDYYSKDSEFVAHCRKSAQVMANEITELAEAGFQVDFIIGVENSPTCATSYMYTHIGMQHRMGIFYGLLDEILHSKGYDIPYIGVNRSHTKKAICEIQQVVHKGDCIYETEKDNSEIV